MRKTSYTPVSCLLIVLSIASWSSAATVTVNLSQTFQTIDGFGAHGAMNVWWSNGPFWNDDFLRQVFDTLGLTMIRTELYPIPDQTEMWTKQIPYLRAVDAYVRARNIPFKFFASIWTPPASMKTNNSTVGGQLKSSEIANYGQYIVNYCRRFKNDVGVDLYAVSAQNEPALCTGYNSACYLPHELTPILIGVADALAASGLPTYLHWPDNIWWGGIWEDFAGATASPNLVKVGKILSYHYAQNDEAGMRRQLALYYNQANGGPNKFRLWNTEFGGYYDDWNGLRNDEFGYQTGDAWTQAQNMHLFLQYGFNAIVWWQLAEPPQPNPVARHYALLYHDASGRPRIGPRGAVMRQFARFIRPEAVRVDCSSSDNNVWAIAFRHAADQTVTVILLNNAGSATTVSVSGEGLPARFDAWQTSPSQNCVFIGSFGRGETINLPVKSITTLYNGSITSTSTSPRSLDLRRERNMPAAEARRHTYSLNGKRADMLRAQASRFPSGLQPYGDVIVVSEDGRMTLRVSR